MTYIDSALRIQFKQYVSLVIIVLYTNSWYNHNLNCIFVVAIIVLAHYPYPLDSAHYLFMCAYIPVERVCRISRAGANQWLILIIFKPICSENGHAVTYTHTTTVAAMPCHHALLLCTLSTNNSGQWRGRNELKFILQLIPTANVYRNWNCADLDNNQSVASMDCGAPRWHNYSVYQLHQ